jgi:hypothetical protein
MPLILAGIPSSPLPLRTGTETPATPAVPPIAERSEPPSSGCRKTGMVGTEGCHLTNRKSSRPFAAPWRGSSAAARPCLILSLEGGLGGIERCGAETGAVDPAAPYRASDRQRAPRRASSSRRASRTPCTRMLPTCLRFAQHDDETHYWRAVLVFVDGVLDRFYLESVGHCLVGDMAAAMEKASSLPETVESGD